MMKQLQSFDGGNTELAEKFNSFSGKNISAKALKQIMNKWRYRLEENNVFFARRANPRQLGLSSRLLPAPTKKHPCGCFVGAFGILAPPKRRIAVWAITYNKSSNGQCSREPPTIRAFFKVTSCANKKAPLWVLRWRRKRDSNPRGVSPKRFSRPPRYDRFDIPAFIKLSCITARKVFPNATRLYLLYPHS